MSTIHWGMHTLFNIHDYALCPKNTFPETKIITWTSGLGDINFSSLLTWEPCTTWLVFCPLLPSWSAEVPTLRRGKLRFLTGWLIDEVRWFFLLHFYGLQLEAYVIWMHMAIYCFQFFFLNMGARVAGSRRKIVGAIQGGEKLIDAPTKSYIMWSPYWTFQIAWVQSSGSLKPLQTSGFNKESMFTFRCGIAFPKRLRPKFFLRSEGCWFYSRLVVGEHLKKPAIGDQFSFSATSFLNGIR